MALNFLARQIAVTKTYEASSLEMESPIMMIQELQRLKIFDRVLYIGAHPDDENNKLLAFLTQNQLVDVAYLSLTRGEGGQNFIGAEKDQELGVLRVQESLAARRVDGAYQFFTRAKDFGFSKSADETLSKWDEKGVLADMVWAIRYFRPNVIITRFSPYIPDAHGHHQASAILASKAYRLAGDPSAYSEQLAEVAPWQAQRLLWNVYQECGIKDIGGEVSPLPHYHAITIPAKDEFSGLHYGEIGAQSRNKHRCQAMGSLIQHKAIVEYFEVLQGAVFSSVRDNALTADLNKPDLYIHNFRNKIDELIEQYTRSPDKDYSSDLAKVLRWTRTVPINHVIHEKCADLERLLLRSLGVSFVAEAAREIWVAGSHVSISLGAIIPQGVDLTLTHVDVPFLEPGYRQDYRLSASTSIAIDGILDPESEPYIPAWLKGEGDANNYTPQSIRDIVLPLDRPIFEVNLQLRFADLHIQLTVPVIHADGPVTVAPPVTATFGSGILLLPDTTSRSVSLRLRSNVSVALAVKVRLKVPEGLYVSPKEIGLVLQGQATEKVHFQLKSYLRKNEIQQIGFEIETDEGIEQCTSRCVDYPHIERALYFPKGVLRVVNSSVRTLAKKIAYVPGRNDEIVECLSQLTKQITIIPLESLQASELSGFDAIVLGVRLYNTNPEVSAAHGQLREYVEGGGVLITQYNTPYDLLDGQIGAYPLTLSHERITSIKSAITFLRPEHRLLNYPNQIRQSDFEHWTQDRALFMPDKWDADLAPILRTQDVKGKLNDGLLLLGTKGKGYYMYTSLSLFRQLPAGVSGAYRLFANMLSIGDAAPVHLTD